MESETVGRGGEVRRWANFPQPWALNTQWDGQDDLLQNQGDFGKGKAPGHLWFTLLCSLSALPSAPGDWNHVLNTWATLMFAFWLDLANGEPLWEIGRREGRGRDPKWLTFPYPSALCYGLPLILELRLFWTALYPQTSLSQGLSDLSFRSMGRTTPPLLARATVLPFVVFLSSHTFVNTPLLTSSQTILIWGWHFLTALSGSWKRIIISQEWYCFKWSFLP